MATKRIRKAAVIGGGVMGQGIAALLASARIPVILYDIVPKDAKDSDDPVARNAYAAGAVQKIKKSRPSLIYTNRDADMYITAANVEDHMDLLADCDFIVEAVPEVLAIKQATFDNVEDHAHPDAIIASNTSGLSIKNMIKDRSDGFKKRFVVTHFFNPVRYMKLLEIVPGESTDPAVMETMAEFGSKVLGKGIVYAKDTTNFIANRIGVHGMMSIMNSMGDHGMTPSDVDVIFGKAMGRPRSAVFGTADVVGLDTFVHVSQNCYDTLVEDEEREVFQIPDFVHAMVEKGWTGRKAKAGFFKKVGKDIHALNLKTMEYEPRVKQRFDSIGAARGASDSAGSIKTVVVDGTDAAAAFAREVTLKSLAYSARRLGEIADDIVNIDRGMRWGFNWELGPFQTWDAIGLAWGRDAMKEAGIEVAGWIDEMIDAGHSSFYKWDGTTELYYDPSTKSYKAIDRPENEQTVDLLRRSGSKLASNDGATLYDGGDDVLVLEFTSKANTVDLDVIGMMEQAVETMEGGHWKGLVIANDADNFSMGANVGLVVGAAKSGAFDQIEQLVKRFQDANQLMRYSSKPVVAVPTGLTLGGGAEVTMGANAVVAAGELYIGLVEFGVGLIPGGGGNLQLMRNVFGMHAGDADFDAFPFIKKIFLTTGMAKVAESAEQAKECGFLTQDAIVSLGRQHVLYKAKQRVLGMAASGFTAPRPATFRLPGRDGYATIDMMLYSMAENNQISAHDRLIGQKLATVLTGGNTAQRVLTSEQDLLDLEREAFMSLCGEEKTQDRMLHMAMKNKPLRN